MIEQSTPKAYSKFLTITSVLAGSLAGFLIAVPLTAHTAGALSVFALSASTGLGLLMGYKQRGNRVFFYVALVTILLLSTIIIQNLATS